MSLFARLILALGLALAFSPLPACSDSDFASGAAGKKGGKDKGKDDGGDDDGGKDAPEGEGEAESGDPEGKGEGGDVDLDGGSDVSDLADGRVKQVFEGEVETEKVPVDIVFAMDTSGSMLQEKASLEAAMAGFITSFETKAKKADYQIWMIGNSFNFPSGTDGKITKVEKKVSSNDALVILKSFFSGGLQNPKPVRDAAKKQIVVVTDDNAKGEVASTFKTFLDATPLMKEKTSVNGIIGLPTSVPTDTCKIAKVGSEYQTLGADATYGGLIQDLCKQDWDALLKDLAEKIIKETARGEFKLKKTADTSKDVEVRVDGSEVDKGDYDFEDNTVVFKEDKKPGDGAKVVVIFTPK